MTKVVDFQVRYEWQEGSLPPPNHYEYTIIIGPGVTGRIEFQPDYSFNFPPIWTEMLKVIEKDVSELYELMKTAGILDRERTLAEIPSVGGNLEWIEGRANGRPFRVPGQIEEKDTVAVRGVILAIRALVPDSVWDEMNGKRERYMRDYQAKKGERK